MFPETLIRPAKPGDSEAIAALMREGVTDQVRRITIMGSPHIAQFIADELAQEGNEEYVVGTMQARVVGMCSWKHTDEALHLNHLYLAWDVRGYGLGTALMLDGLNRIQRASERALSVDVFFDNPRAQNWYRALTMQPEKPVHWVRLPLPMVRSGDRSGYTISGLAEATAKHLRYGFSQFALSTRSAHYHIGQLGAHEFRVGTVSILQDCAALEGLAQIDPKRQLLCIASAEDCAQLTLDANTCVAKSERLVSSCAVVRERLESSLSRRRNLRQTIPIRFPMGS
ncbi:MAG: N-acetyltransferase family protein [Nitrospira sp.]